MLGFRVHLLDQARWIPSLGVGMRDVSGTRQRHTSYLVASRSQRMSFVDLSASIGYSRPILEASGYEMEQGIFYGAKLAVRDRLEVMYEMDTTAHHYGVRAWPLKWIWASAFLTSLDETGYSFGIARVLGSD